jgi:hypothetical protein
MTCILHHIRPNVYGQCTNTQACTQCELQQEHTSTAAATQKALLNLFEALLRNSIAHVTVQAGHIYNDNNNNNPLEGVGGALGATARKPSLPIPIWRSRQRNLAESEGNFWHTRMVLRTDRSHI